MSKLGIITILSLLMFQSAVAAEKQNFKSSAIYSPGCTKEQIKQLAGDALTKISEQQNWDNHVEGYIVTLDLNKMDFSALTTKMMKSKCYEKAVKQD